MSTYGYLVLCIQACLIQNALGQYLNRSFGRKGLGLEVDVEAVSRRAGLGNFGLNNYRLNGGLTNFEERGVAKGIGLNNLGARGINFNNVGGREISLNNLGARGINLSNVGVTGIGNNIGASYSGELLGVSKYGVGVGVPNVAAVSGVPVTGPFVSNGGGEIIVGGEIAAAGTTLVAGQLPVLGAVGFSGPIPARGVVSIAGECGCSRIPL